MFLRGINLIYIVQLERKTDPHSWLEINTRKDLNILVWFSELFLKS
jgi:hypothetical protein